MRPDGLLLLTLLSTPSLADAEDEAQAAMLALDETQATAGPSPRVLEGMTVVLSPGHGKHMHISIDGHTELTWDFQRKRRHGMREDTWTAAFVTDHLAPALEARGATVLSLRARDRHHEVVFADDADTTFELTEGWPVPNQDAWGDAHHVVLPGGTARWILTAPADGRWFVATRWTSDPALQASATYRLSSKTATTTTQVDQTLHGGVWWPLGYADLRAGETLEVTLDAGDQPALADAVRMGGGTFTGRDPHTKRADVVSRFDLAAVHQLEYLGGPESLLTEDDGSILSDMRFRPRWASWAFEGDEGVTGVRLGSLLDPNTRVLADYKDLGASPGCPKRFKRDILLPRILADLEKRAARLAEAGAGATISPERAAVTNALLDFYASGEQSVACCLWFYSRRVDAKHLAGTYRESGDDFLRRHATQRAKLRRSVELVGRGERVVTSAALEREGVRPGPGMGRLLALAQATSAELGLFEEEEVLKALRASPHWPAANGADRVRQEEEEGKAV